MRALTVVYGLNVGGGIESFLVDFFQHATAARPDVEYEVCNIDRRAGADGGLQAERLRALGVRVWTCKYVMNPLAMARKFRHELARRGPYDALHAHCGNFAGPLLSAARSAGVRVRLAHYHNCSAYQRNDWKRRVLDWVLRREVLRDATGIVGCSWAALQNWFPREWARDSRMFVIRNGILTDRFSGVGSGADVRAEFNIPLGAPVIGHVGRFSWQKNHAGLIEAARLVVQRRPETRFLLVGDGPLREQIESQAAALGLQNHVIFAGMRDDVPRLLSAMDVFTLPSVSEGFGLAAVEAQAAGLPVAATNLPGPREAIAPEFRDYAFDPQKPAALAHSMLALLDQTKRAPELRDAARAFGAQFAIEHSTQAMLAAWGDEKAVLPADPADWAAPKRVAARPRVRPMLARLFAPQPTPAIATGR